MIGVPVEVVINEVDLALRSGANGFVFTVNRDRSRLSPDGECVYVTVRVGGADGHGPGEIVGVFERIERGVLEKLKTDVLIFPENPESETPGA